MATPKLYPDQTDAGSGLSYQETFTQKNVSSKAFFDGLAKRATKKAHQLALDKADAMAYTLTHRGNLGKNWGKYPKWVPKKGELPRTTNRSFAGWHVVRKEAGIYVLRNDVGNTHDTGKWGGYAYPRNLVTGNYWSHTARAGNRLVRRGDKFFSKEMPYGLAPWLRHKRNELVNEISKAIRNKK